MNFCKDFWIHNLNNVAILPRSGVHGKWLKAPSSTLQINFDVAWDNRKVGMSFIVRD